MIAVLAFLSGIMKTDAAGMPDSVSVRNVFASMPDSVFELIPKGARLDCLDFFDSNMRSTVRDRMDGLIQITSLSRDFLQLQSDSSLFVCFKILPCSRQNDGYIICVSTTLKGSSDYSKLDFYNSDWNRLSGEDYITMPGLKRFVNSGYAKKDSLALLESVLPFVSYSIMIGDSEPVMEISLTSQNQLGKEDSVYFSDWFAGRPVIFKWNGKRFK